MFRIWLRRQFDRVAAASGKRRPAPRRRADRPRLEVLEDRTLLSARLVADINTTAASSNPSGFASLNGAAYFFADDGQHGVELWKSDGTSGGTQLVKDINPGAGSAALPASPAPAVVGGHLYFFANDGTHGTQLWTSDGTAGGTIPLSGPAPGAVVTVNQVAGAGGTVFFADPATNELWQTNGTVAGTVPVTAAGRPIASPSDLTNVGGALYFRGAQAGTAAGLWKTDGTTTSFVEPVGGAISDLTDVGGTAYFVVRTPAGSGQEDVALWSSDGTPGGTGLVRDFGTVTSPAPPPVADLTALNGKLYFAAADLTTGTELWVSDGTPSGTHAVKDINPGSGSALGAGADLTAFNGSLYFFADDGHGAALWRSDGTQGGTAKVLDGGSNAITGGGIVAVAGGNLYFTGTSPAGSGLWKIDGTTGAPSFVQAATVGASAAGADANGTLLFPAADATHGTELWKSNGTPGGTRLLTDINPGTSSGPQAITDVNGTAFFLADDGSHGVELWKSDGTQAGTALVKDVAPGSASGAGLAGPARLLNVNGTVYFFASDGNPADGTVQLWKSNGTAASTQLVRGFTPGQAGPFGFLAGLPGTLTAVNGKVFFVADDGTHGLQLWTTDGTAGGTVMVPGLNAGPDGSDPANLTAVGGTLFFTATDGTSTGLWKINGTTPTFLAAGAANLVNVGGTLFFTAPDTANPQNSALWETDGTSTTLVKGLGQGNSARLLTNVNGTLAFVVDGTGPEALWASRGTAGTTVSLQPFSGSQLSELTAVGSTLYFINTGSGGPELWQSSLNAGGTSRVLALTSPGGVFGLTNVNGTLVFAAGGSAGAEVWTSTAAGTMLLQDVNPGPVSSFPHGFAAVGGHLFFAANGGIPGTELYADTGGTSRPATSVTLTASTTTLALGNAVTLTATVKPSPGSTAGGSVTFLDGGVELGTVPVLAGGTAVLQAPLGLGSHNNITAVYSGDVNNAGSSTALAVTITVQSGPATTTTGLTASDATVTPGEFVTFTAVVKPPTGNVDGGVVDFTDGTTDLGTVAVDANGVATLSVALPYGQHSVIATYVGDPNFSGSMSQAVPVTVSQPPATTLMLTAPTTPVNQGDPVTFTATVTTAQGAVTSGTVDFRDGTTDLGTVAVNAQGVAQLTRVLTAGTHNVVAVYNGDPAFATSMSAVQVTVAQSSNSSPTTTSLGVSPAASVPQGQPVTFTATVTSGANPAVGGTVEFIDGNTTLGFAPVGNGGVAQLTVTLDVGLHQVLAIYSGDQGFNGSESPGVDVTVTGSAASDDTISLTALPASVPEGQPVTLTAQVLASAGPVTVGSVEFFDGSVDLGSVLLNSQGFAVLSPVLGVGPHSLIAEFLGTSDFVAKTSQAVTVTVTKAAGASDTLTGLTASPQAVTLGQPVTFTASVTAAGVAVTTGTVDFLEGLTDLGTAFLNSQGVATLPLVLGVGPHTVVAVYSGVVSQFHASSSPGFTVTVNPSASVGDTTTTLNAPSTTVPPGQAVTLTAAVHSDQGPAQGGTVEFLDGTTDLGPATVNSQGVATLQMVFGVGTHTVVAVYSGTPSLHGSTSNTASFTVGSSGPAATITSLTASALDLDQGQEVTLSSTVSSMVNGTLQPLNSGTVMFLDGGTVFASAAIDPGSGTAVLQTVLGPGKHTITAVFLAETGLSGSNSTPLVITVEQAPAAPLTGDVTALVQASMVPAPGGPKGKGLTKVLGILNTSGQSLEGPLYVVISGLKPGVTIRGAAGFVRRGKKKSPFVIINPTGGSTVKPNDLLTALLRFSAKPKGFTVSVSAGLPPA
jgi:ELWxxDGT repeat protein